MTAGETLGEDTIPFVLQGLKKLKTMKIDIRFSPEMTSRKRDHVFSRQFGSVCALCGISVADVQDRAIELWQDSWNCAFWKARRRIKRVSR